MPKMPGCFEADGLTCTVQYRNTPLNVEAGAELRFTTPPLPNQNGIARHQFCYALRAIGTGLDSSLY